MPSSHGVGTQSPTYGLAEYGTASGLVHLQPKPGHQFTVLIGPAGPTEQVSSSDPEMILLSPVRYS